MLASTWESVQYFLIKSLFQVIAHSEKNRHAISIFLFLRHFSFDKFKLFKQDCKRKEACVPPKAGNDWIYAILAEQIQFKVSLLLPPKPCIKNMHVHDIRTCIRMYKPEMLASMS